LPVEVKIRNSGIFPSHLLHLSFMLDHEKGFRGLGIAPGILEILAKRGFTKPTPIQEQSIPIAIEGKDMMGVAQTGTGKTLAFGIPLLQHLLQGNGLGLVVVPTRELALQVNEALEQVATPLRVRTATIIGGESMFRQLQRLARHPQIIIGTPGRIIDHLERKSLSLAKVSVLVLDEADRMLDMGFAPQIKRILAVLPRERQTMLFSATMPEQIISMARAYLKLPVRVEIARSGTTVKDVTQELFFVAQETKPRLLEKVLQEYRGSVLVFARTKHGAKKIAAYVRTLGHTASEIHANRSMNQRREALDGFKKGRYRVLVATDIAARGIDVVGIELVINFDLPSTAEDYVHRIGRTARAGESGHAISFARPNERGDVQAIERLMRITLPITKLPALPPNETLRAAPVAHRPSHFAPAGNRFGPRPPHPSSRFNPRFHRGGPSRFRSSPGRSR
jgi:ATP-dependent RNA helicase RhlE